jgi:NO-binding membrane sensor protein with MHYT domain
MFQIFNCLKTEHDWRLVALAFAICLLASVVAISLFHRAKVSPGGMKMVWLGLDAAAGGCGIWATHFIAMLAFDPGVSASYDLQLTILSLVFAVIFSGVGFGIALLNVSRLGSALGGAMIGAGIAAMHTRVCRRLSFQDILHGRLGSLWHRSFLALYSPA